LHTRKNQSDQERILVASILEEIHSISIKHSQANKQLGDLWPSRNEESKKIYITIDFEWVEGHVGADSVPNLLSVTGCKLLEPKISTAGPAETASQVFPVLVDGTIIGMKGHMHNGGEKMVLILNDKEICTSSAEYDASNGISSMGACDQKIPVKKGDLIKLKSVYDIAKHPMRSSAHGGASGDIIGGHDLMGMFTMSIAYDKQ